MMTSQKIALQRIALATVALLYGMGTDIGLAQTVPNAGLSNAQEQFAPQQPPPANSAATPDLQPAASSLDLAPVSQDATQNTTPVCPTGEFASAFPDVPPDHWAFTAVNRLAATPIRCFPVSPQSSTLTLVI